MTTEPFVEPGCGSDLCEYAHLWFWVPARAEPVIGRRFAPTRWLGRDDVEAIC